MRETAVEQRIANELARLGFQSRHMHDRFFPGTWDRYVVGGNWIEFKVMKMGDQCRSYNLLRQFSPEQRAFGASWHKAGDRMFGCVLIGDHLVFEPWERFQKPWHRDHIVEQPNYYTRGAVVDHIRTIAESYFRNPSLAVI